MSSISPACSSGVVTRPGLDRIWVRPRIVVIGVRSSCEMTSRNASRKVPARRSSSTSWSRWASRRRASVMSWPVPTIRIGDARGVAEDAADAVGPVDGAIRPEEAELEVERRPAGERRIDRRSGTRRDRRDGSSRCSARRSASRRWARARAAGRSPRTRRRSPVRTSHSQKPVPGRRQHELEALVASLEVRRHRADLVDGDRETVARRAERGDERRDDGAAGEVQDEPGHVDLRQLERGAVQPDEDRRVRDPGHDRRGEPAGQTADPGGDGDGAGQDDEASLAAKRRIQRRPSRGSPARPRSGRSRSRPAARRATRPSLGRSSLARRRAARSDLVVSPRSPVGVVSAVPPIRRGWSRHGYHTGR